MRIAVFLLALVMFSPVLAAIDDPPKEFTAKGETIEGLRDGTWKFVDGAEVTRYEIEYHRGKRSGTFKQWSAAGKLVALGECFDDKRHGNWDEFHENGERSSSGEFFAGVRHGPWVAYHDNGKKCEEGAFEVGKREGYWTGYHTDGSLNFSGMYAKDVKHGEWVLYFRGGQIQESGQFVRDVRQGRWREWGSDGTLVGDLVYADGNVEAVSVQPGLQAKAKLKEYHVVALWQGMQMRGEPIETDGELLGRVTVRITRTGLPQVLLLSGHKPIEWELDLAAGVVIDKIVLGGKHRQQVSNPPAGVSVVAEFESDGSEAGLFFANQDEMHRQAAFDARVTKYLGVAPTTLQSSHGHSTRMMIGRTAEPAIAPPEDAELHCVGVYEGTTPRQREFREHLIGDVTVNVNRTGVPLVLALCSYEPVKWTLVVAEGVEIHAVLLSGYYEQSVTGAPESVPVHNLSADGKSRFYCYDRSKPEFRRLSLTLRDVTGMELTDFQGAYRGSTFEIKVGTTILPPPPLDAQMHVFCAGKGTPVPGKPDEEAIKVRVKNSDAEIVLVLGAIEDVTWNIEVEEGVVIERIILIGSGKSRVRGLPAGCHVVRHTKAVQGEKHIQAVGSPDAPEAEGLKLKLKDLTALAVSSLTAVAEAKELVLD